MHQHIPNESREYRQARDKLLAMEIELRRQAEAVARARRALPPGGELKEDYAFKVMDRSGQVKTVRLSELFGENDTLAIYSYMSSDPKDPCNMCTPIMQSFNGAHKHIRQRLSFVAVSEAPPERLHELKENYGLDQIPIVSAAGTSYNKDYFGKNEKGHDDTMLNVFHRDGKTIRHFWATELVNAPQDPGQDHRGIDSLNPIFTFFDLTPEGREDWYTKIAYKHDKGEAVEYRLH